MTYALVDGETLLKHPYTFANLRADNPDVSFPAEPGIEHFEAFGAIPVQPSEPPVEAGKQAVEADPVHVGGIWMQGWLLLDLPRRMVPKWLIVERLTDEQLEAAMGLMSLRQAERWRAAAFPNIYTDDPEMLAVLAAVGADPAVVLRGEQ